MSAKESPGSRRGTRRLVRELKEHRTKEAKTKEWVVINVDGTMERHTGKPSYDQMNKTLGGHSAVENIPEFKRFEDVPCDAWCDEESRMRGEPANPVASKLWHENIAANAKGRAWAKYDLHGPVIIVKKR